MLIKICAADAHWIMLNLYHTCVDHWHSQIVVPALPGKALKRQLPFRPDEGLFEESFIEERRVGLEQFINRSVDVLPLPFYMFSLCSICIWADILKNKQRKQRAVKRVAFPLCARLQNCRSPSGPERALSSHVPAGGNHRPRLHSRKSTTLGLLRWLGVKFWGAGWTGLPSSYLPFFCLSA